MSAFVKQKIKAARDLLGKKEYDKAREAALGVLEYEPDNYHANVFLGLACLNVGQYKQSEQAYRKAIETDPKQLLAWQGLSKFYEERQNWPEYLKTLEKLAQLHSQANDAVKCAEAIQKIVDVRRDPERSSKLELADTLWLLLPGSEFYPVLSTLPPPDPTNPTSTTIFAVQSALANSLPILEELIFIYEQNEDAIIRSEVDKRRQRLGAPPPDQIRQEVAMEVLSKSKLPELYNEVLNHAHTSDELRRATESKLLQMKQRHLFAIPAGGKQKDVKARLAAEVDELVNGIVLLKIPNELAWTLYVEAKDAAYIEDYDFGILRQFIKLFPDSSLGNLLEAYFQYIGVPLNDEEDEEAHPRAEPEEETDYIEIMMEAFTRLTESILAHRIIAELYEQDADYPNAIKIAESGLELVRRAEQNWGRSLKLVRKAFNITLATSLVHYFPPKNHVRALRIIDELLGDDPDNIATLMGRGFILQYAKKWSEAAFIFDKVARLDSEGISHGVRAMEEHAWSEAMCEHLEEAAAELQNVIQTLDALEGREEDKARAWWRLGRCYWDMGGAHREEAYKHFVTALKRSSTFAPAFTSLGIYYAEFLSPPDPKRASKCFQKAFELDPREADAARRLAEGFAEEGEWDLVEVVARRTIEGEGGLEEGPEAKASRRYLPINAWAWKAVGAVEMTRRNYVAAIEPFQIALRTDVDDHMSWLRLGEAYNKAGRYAAAIKALERARELEPGDWVAAYFIGDVERQMGAYEDALAAFASILERRPDELGVLHSLGQTHLELGRAEVATGFAARAEASFVSAARRTLELVAASPGFRRVAWKTIADALFRLAEIEVYTDEEDVLEVVSSIVPLVTDHPGKGLTDILTHPLTHDEGTALSLFTLQVALAAYEYRLSLGAVDDAAKGAAHYDLGIALCAFARRTLDSAKREKAEQEAVAQFKHALRLEPMNDSFWIALGNATFTSQPALAQHAYVRALEIDGKNAATWTSLGMFYLEHKDVELANEAFYKAQTLDPDYALAWVGQGLVATANKHDSDASALFEHASGLTAAVPEADLQYATRLFAKVNNTSSPSTSSASAAAALLPAFFVLERACRQRPNDAGAAHLCALVCERVGHVELAIRHAERAIALLEAAYEETEDPVVERRFTVTHTNAARMRLRVGDFEGALESYGVVLGLLADDGGDGGDEQAAEEDAGKLERDAETRVLRAQAQFGSGLAHFKLGQLQEALGLFESAMESAGEDAVIRGHVVVLLAQALWAIGTDEAKESAKTQLLQSIEFDPENLMAINALAGMGILTDDDGLVDAALSELLSLPIDQRYERDPEREVTYLLIQHHLGQGDTTQALSVAKKAVFAEPERADVRHKLVALTLQSGESAAARAVLEGSAQAHGDLAQLRASLALHAVALCLETDNVSGVEEGKTEAHRLAQKGVMLSPWDRQAWETLAYVRCRNGA